MSRARLAELHLELSRICAEIAEEYAREDAANDVEEKPEPKPKKRPRAKAFPPPLHPVSDTDRIRAEKMLRRRGMT